MPVFCPYHSLYWSYVCIHVASVLFVVMQLVSFNSTPFKLTTETHMIIQYTSAFDCVYVTAVKSVSSFCFINPQGRKQRRKGGDKARGEAFTSLYFRIPTSPSILPYPSLSLSLFLNRLYELLNMDSLKEVYVWNNFSFSSPDWPSVKVEQLWCFPWVKQVVYSSSFSKRRFLFLSLFFVPPKYSLLLVFFSSPSWTTICLGGGGLLVLFGFWSLSQLGSCNSPYFIWKIRLEKVHARGCWTLIHSIYCIPWTGFHVSHHLLYMYSLLA